MLISKKQNFLIIISEINIIFTIIENFKNNINIIVYKEYKFNNNEIINNIIFKYKLLINHILDFIKEYNVRYFDLIINLSNSEIKEKIISKKEFQNIKIDEKFITQITEIQYYPEYLFYKINIRPYIIFQYNLLAYYLKSNIQLFTTEFLNYYYFYKYIILKKENLTNYTLDEYKIKIEEKSKDLISNLIRNCQVNLNLNNSIVILGLYHKLNHN